MTLAFSILNLEGAVAFAIGLTAAVGLFLWRERQLRAARELERRSLLDAARREADSIQRESRLKAQEDALKLREDTEKSFASRLGEVTSAERRISEREATVNQRLDNLSHRERKLSHDEESLAAQHALLKSRGDELHRLEREHSEHLQKLAGITEAEARTEVLHLAEQSALKDAAGLTRRVLDEARILAEDKARRVISLAIQRYAAQHTIDSTTASITLTGDDIKGRIIGREGRNIRAFENAAGVTVMIDDTPGCVVLSGFDPVRREIAREAMQRLILDGRIHPTRIDEVVAQVREEMGESVIRYGEEAVGRLGLPPMKPEVVELLGKLRFRHSFSQNVLEHSIEVAQLMALMAAELGINVADAKRAGLLHDIGKAVSHEIEGPHAIVGADFLKRCGEAPLIVNAVAAHHDEVPHESPLGILVSAADAISGSRPGARSETMTTYLKRLEDLEQIAVAFSGVDKAYAVQAGRELRVFVLNDQVNDDAAAALARNIVRRIEDQLQYPGQIRVTVIRETRIVEFAK